MLVPCHCGTDTPAPRGVGGRGGSCFIGLAGFSGSGHAEGSEAAYLALSSLEPWLGRPMASWQHLEAYLATTNWGDHPPALPEAVSTPGSQKQQGQTAFLLQPLFGMLLWQDQSFRFEGGHRASSFSPWLGSAELHHPCWCLANPSMSGPTSQAVKWRRYRWHSTASGWRQCYQPLITGRREPHCFC